MEFRTEFADYKDELAFLRAYLTEQGYLYYVLDAPVIPDYEYDRLNRRLEELEAEHPEEITPDSPTQRVGGKILDAFQPYTHEVPLESLQDVFNEGEVAAFCEKMEEALGPMAEYSVEPKVDGLSVALEYRDGVFVRGATRGDGRVGEDVTENLRTVRSIPMTLPEKLPRLIVRGEVYMARSVFESINAKRELEGKPLMANPRNAAAGSLRQLDSKICAQRQLDIAVFNLQLAEGREFTSHAETLDYLASQRFKVIPHKTLRGTSEIQTEIFRINDERMDYPFDIDGAVVKVNSLSDRTILGSTAKFPKWAVAYKYPPEKKYATVTDIVVQVGRTGVLTPKAVLTPVRLAGTTVTNATLHNQDFITEKDIRIGDTVLVQKAGEIIPEILSVDLTKRPEGAKSYTLPTVCPVCGARTEVYSRITGYYRPVGNWNDGKTQEYKERKVYNIEKSVLKHGAPQKSAVQTPAAYSDDILLLTTKTCPNCKAAKQMLDKSGILYTVIDAENNPEIAEKFNVHQAPTLISGQNVYSGIASVKQFISAMAKEA